MRSGGQTTVIQRILEKRAEKPPEIQEDTSATIAVMLRVLPPPRALLVIEGAALLQQLEDLITADVLEIESISDEFEAVSSFTAEFRPVIITDNLELIRKVRARQTNRAAYILYVADLDEGMEREAGLIAGADDCIGRRAPERELQARIGAAKRIAELEAVLRIALVENRKLSTTDDLTRVASRRFFTKHFPREVERAARYGRALALILCDIDHFKNVNDTLGHAGGDEVLRQFGRRLQDELRRGVDWVARIGGEEFAIVLPETNYEQALDVARKLRAGVANKKFEAQNRSVEITASFGLCGLQSVPLGVRKIAENLVKVADAALYRSKNAGRNRVTATTYPCDQNAAKKPSKP
ncbi:MAG: two-component system, cell cycle response regulator [Gammaproteobacteria bacterium]|jgi:two-component system cell cycle response regulator|nr:two-component system, cell cycle response regulator [Gammaproteobacteria bacterium]